VAKFYQTLLNRLGHRKRFESSEVNPSEIALPGWARGGLTTLAWSIISLTGIIYITIIIGSFVRLWGVDYTFTPHHYTSVEAMPGFVTSIKGVEPVWISLRIAAIAAPLGGLLALVIAFFYSSANIFFISI
jgi:iron(III) transport system permease protein